jgi:hypothetical protein
MTRGTSRESRRGLSRSWRNGLLALHIAVSVAILGDSAAFLAIVLRARTLPAADAHASYEVLGMLSLVFGIPLSFLALGTGVALGLGTRWGVFRYPWVIAKLALLVSVLVVGGAVLGPAEDAALDGTGGTAMLVAGATWDVIALLAAISLSVFKPGRPVRRRVARPVAAGLSVLVGVVAVGAAPTSPAAASGSAEPVRSTCTPAPLRPGPGPPQRGCEAT